MIREAFALVSVAVGRNHINGAAMTYDSWKTMTPEDENPCCEYCGASERLVRKGWMPDCCTGECGISWRDPDAEYEAWRDDR